MRPVNERGTETRLADGADGLNRTARYRRWFGAGARVGVLAGALCLVQSAAYAQAPPAGAAAPASGAAAKPNLAEAKKQYAAGEASFKSGDYASALTSFQSADSIKPTPQNARYIALSQDKLGQYSEAVAAYERFLSEVPPNLKKEGDEATKRVAEIKALPGKVHVESTPAAAQLTVDGAPAQSPTPADLDLAPGKHSIHVAAEGFVAQDKDVEVTYGSKQDVKAELEAVAPPPPPPVAAEPAPPPPAPEAPPAAPRSKIPALVTGGIAVAAAGVGTVFGIMALSDKSDYDKHPTSSKADDGENHALIADMAIGVAITLGITSAVLFFSAEEPAAKPAAKAAPHKAVAAAPKAPPITIRPTPIVTPHGGGAGALIRF